MTFPNSTFYNHRIPKTKFYENIQTTPEIKRLFVEQVDTIIWQNKLSPTTFNVDEGQFVKEIEVFRIAINKPEIDKKLLQVIDESIPYHILFLLDYQGKIAPWVAYKEISANKSKAIRYFHGSGQSENEVELSITGLNMDAIYENFLRGIAGENLPWKSGDTVQIAVIRAMEGEKIDRQIDISRKKMQNEKQFNRQVEMNEEIRRLMMLKVQ